MKILNTDQVRKADAYTIQNEPIRSLDLMERAAIQLFHEFTRLYPNPRKVVVYAGPGNNGGDGIALSRMLAENNYPVDLNILDLGNGLSSDAEDNVRRLPEVAWLKTYMIKDDEEMYFPDAEYIIVDALFGSGLTRPLSGVPARLVHHINNCSNDLLAIDIPSGLFGDDNTNNPMTAVIRANNTLSLHCPKLAFMMPENEEFVGDWKVLPIGLDDDYNNSLHGLGYVIDLNHVRKILIKRNKFDHKGHFGHALLLAGTAGKLGAAALAAKASLRSGLGLLTCHVPEIALPILQSIVPEAMLSLDADINECSVLPDLTPYSAVGVGPGIGIRQKQVDLLTTLLGKGNEPMVLDADALNILAANPDLIAKLPPKTVLTPHLGEYKRLFGEDDSHFSRLQRLKKICHKHNLIVVLKGAHTAVVMPNQDIWFNNNGNPGMATAGSGDVLTGIVLSLLAQKYPPEEAAILAVYLHGAAGDIAAQSIGEESLLASDIVEKIGQAFIEIH
ncbi:MAG: NAD(P)H-hydrate dehydratase [Bacteroidales bacterium]|nr:NAD(P)H-hydrate dehydratase [Bacteroidales bacterium]